MAKETFEVSGPGYLEHAGIKLGERLWGDTLICNRVEVRQTRAEFEVQWTEFERSVLYDESERRWNATKCQVWEVFSNKAAAIERAKFIERDYCQAAEEDLLDRQEIALERDRADRWQNQAGTHFDLRGLEPILNRLTNAASHLAKGVLTNREYYGRMKQIVRILQMPQQFVEPRFRD